MAVTVVCPQCKEAGRGRVVMRHRGEGESSNVFDCPVCERLAYEGVAPAITRNVTKDKTGGTMGAGRRSDGVRGAVGVGFGPGTATFRGKLKE